jgi:hypothetical protein
VEEIAQSQIPQPTAAVHENQPAGSWQWTNWGHTWVPYPPFTPIPPTMIPEDTSRVTQPQPPEPQESIPRPLDPWQVTGGDPWANDKGNHPVVEEQQQQQQGSSPAVNPWNSYQGRAVMERMLKDVIRKGKGSGAGTPTSGKPPDKGHTGVTWNPDQNSLLDWYKSCEKKKTGNMSSQVRQLDPSVYGAANQPIGYPWSYANAVAAAGGGSS